jgi:Holliday junction resolvase
MARSNKRRGYSTERDTVLKLVSNGIFAMRIPSRQQIGEKRGLDIIAAVRPMFIQAKRHKKLLGGPEKERFFALCKKYNAIPCLSWKDRGIHIEDLTTGVEMTFNNEKLG